MVPNQIEREVVISAPLDRVWSALTEPQHLGTWFASDGAEIELRPGGRMVMNWKEHGRFLATVERVEPPHFFSFRGSRLPDDPVGEGNSTLVEFTLTPTAEGTLLRVVESGFRDLKISDEEKIEAVTGNIQGWIGAFTELTAYTERLAA